MKKLYNEPEFELINIRLLSDVLGLSQPKPEDDVQDATGEYFEPTVWDDV